MSVQAMSGRMRVTETESESGIYFDMVQIFVHVQIPECMNGILSAQNANAFCSKNSYSDGNIE